MQEYEYDVALSFAGEDRRHAQELADYLDKDGYSVFYDQYELGDLWGKNLYTHLSSVYKDKARYCVVFLSKDYAQKLWANHELQSAQARAFEENKEYILPVRLDDTEIQGILQTVGYLDLRQITIEKVYQSLIRKLLGKQSQVTPTSVIPLTSEDTSGEFVLLRSEEEKLYFVPLQNVRRDSEDISLELLPESPEEVAFLRTLQDGLRDGFASRRTSLTCAYRDNAAWVIPHEIVETGSHWEVTLKISSNKSNYGLFGSTDNQIAEMRARRILLDENLDSPNSLQTHNTGLDQLFSEIQIRGMESSPHEPNIQVIESPIPLLYQQFKQTPEKFKKSARLVSILYLILSNTVENVLQLDLELRGPTQLYVKFKGICPKVASNVDASVLEFEGTCPLSG